MCRIMFLMPMRENQTGRKSKYSPQMQAALCRWLKKGCSFKDACAMEGISYETFRTWQTEKSVFSVAIKKAEAECNQFLSSIDASTNLGKRDKAICALLLINGIRLCEVARANIGDLSEVNGLKVLRIRGKGGKNIDTRMRDDVYAVIQSYLKTRSSLKTSDPLFIGTNHTAKDRIARRTIQHMVRLRLKRIGINRPNISVHSLRHSSITHLINGGASLIAAADFARHSNPNTTQRYFHNLERLKNSAVMLQPIRVD